MGKTLAIIAGVFALIALFVGAALAALTGSLAIDAAETAPTIPPEVEAVYRQVARRTGVHWVALAAWDAAENHFDLPLPTRAEILAGLISDLLDQRRREAEEFCLEHPEDTSQCPPPAPELTPADEARLWHRAQDLWQGQLTRYVEAHATALGADLPTLEKSPETIFSRFLSRTHAATAAELLEGLLVLDMMQHDSDEVLVDPVEPPEGWTPVGGFAWPVLAPITSRFGYRVSPIDGVRRLHAGIDLGVATGTPIRASKSGTVTTAQWDDIYGNMVIVDHGDGYSTLYAHGSQLVVHPGERVDQGDVVSYSGSTGASTGPHLHFEIHYNGAPVDPLLLLTERSRGD